MENLITQEITKKLNKIIKEELIDPMIILKIIKDIEDLDEKINKLKSEPKNLIMEEAFSNYEGDVAQIVSAMISSSKGFNVLLDDFHDCVYKSIIKVRKALTCDISKQIEDDKNQKK